MGRLHSLRGTAPHFQSARDYIVTANNQVIRNDYKHFLSAYWAPGFRYKRIAELIEGNAPHDVASVARMQMDSKSLLAESLLPYVLAALLAESEPVSNEAIGYLQEWDRHNTKDSVAATVYHEFLLRFARNTFVDEMGQKLAEEYLADYYLWLERFMLLIKENSSWFDDVRTEVVETRDEIAVRSFKEALAALERRLGRNMADWQWGRVHQIQFPHPLSRGSRLARRFFNLGPFQFPGDGESINRGTFAFNEPYDVTMAASLRHVMDFSDLGSILAIHPTGQSGNFMSDRYDDFLDMWLNGTYATMTTDREDILDDADGYLRLIPFEHTSSP
jgi:penicillin amidase